MDSADRHARVARFRALHTSARPLLLPNPWDAGSARLLSALGFEALGTTSLGVSLARGRRRACLSRVLDNAQEIIEATRLPVNVDLEDGFAVDSQGVADAITAAGKVGAAGASIEDATGDPAHPIYAFDVAVDRVRGAVEAARALPASPLITARAENFLHGVRDLDDTVRRLQAFADAGADVLYAPGLHTLDEMRAVVDAVARPVNVVMGFADPSITLDDLQRIGVRRVSIGGALYRLALGSFLDGARRMHAGDFTFLRDMATLEVLSPALSDTAVIDDH